MSCASRPGRGEEDVKQGAVFYESGTRHGGRVCIAGGGGPLNIAPPVCATFHGGHILIESSCFSLTPLDFPAARLNKVPGACFTGRLKCLVVLAANMTWEAKEEEVDWRVAWKCCLPLECNVQVDSWTDACCIMHGLHTAFRFVAAFFGCL